MLRKIFSKRLDGPIVFMDDSHAPSLWTKFLQLKKEDKVQHLKKMVQGQQEEEHNEEEEEVEEEEQTSWSRRKLLETVFGKELNNKAEKNKGTAGSPDSYNLYDKKPDFRNPYGWSSALDGNDYPPLKTPDTGVFHVNLTAVSKQALKTFQFVYQTFFIFSSSFSCILCVCVCGRDQ